MKIRKASADEASLLTQIASESKAYWGYDKEFMEACREEIRVTVENINSELMNYQICENDGEVLGFYSIEKLSNEEAELEALFVKPAYIRKGYGKLLWEHALTFCKSKGYKLLRIQSDPNAEKFYLAAGAILVGKLESKSIKGRYLSLFNCKL